MHCPALEYLYGGLPENSAGLPVMVWIPVSMFEYHGTGASPWYDGSRFARDGVIDQVTTEALAGAVAAYGSRPTVTVMPQLPRSPPFHFVIQEL